MQIPTQAAKLLCIQRTSLGYCVRQVVRCELRLHSQIHLLLKSEEDVLLLYIVEGKA